MGLVDNIEIDSLEGYSQKEIRRIIKDIIAMDRERDEDSLSQYYESDFYDCLIISVNGKLLGYALISVFDDYIKLDNIFIEGDYRSSGYGSILLKYILEEYMFDGWEVNTCSLECSIYNVHALMMYLKHGFIIDGYINNFYENKIPAVWMNYSHNRKE